MGKKPWLTSDSIVSTIERRIMVPLSEVTFSKSDLLDFCNQELMGSQVPSVLQYHEEYFVQSILVPLEPNVTRYPIPNRALGMKLRGIFYVDSQNQSYDMTRINPDDQSYFLNAADSNVNPYRYMFQNNDVVLSINQLSNPTGSLMMNFFMRPNQLVANDQAATIQSFQKTLTLVSNLSVGDTLVIGEKSFPQNTIDNLPNQTTAGIISGKSITFTAVASSPSALEFVVGASNIDTATNLVNAINLDGTYSATNAFPATNLVTINYNTVLTGFLASNTAAMTIPTTQTVLVDAVPSTFTNNTFYDILQTLPGHRIVNYDVLLGNNAVSGNTITFPTNTMPPSTLLGDYICLANECIIPQLPPEFHNILVERTCARVLSALGDTEGLNNSKQMISEMETAQGKMAQNRSDGNVQKVLARKSLLHYGKNIRRNIV